MTPQLDCLGITCTDLAATLAFYRLLGLDIPAGAESEPHVETVLPGGMRLCFDAVDVIRSFDPAWSAPQGSPRVALAFRCADAAEVDKRYAEVVDAGYTGHKPPWDAFWGQRYAVLHDPEGNGVDLYAPNG